MKWKPAPPNAPHLGTKLRDYMEAHYIIQARVARACQITPEAFNRIMRGSLPWNEPLFVRACQISGVPTDLVTIWRQMAPADTTTNSAA